MRKYNQFSREIIMARGNIALILASAFVVVDLALIVMVNTPTDTRVTTAPLVAPENQFMITLVLVGAAIIASLAAIFFKFKPVPAC